MSFFKRHPDLLKPKPVVGPTARQQAVSGSVRAIKLIAFLALAAIVIAAPFAYVGLRAAMRVAHGQGELQAAERLVSGFDFTAALAHLNAASRDFTAGREDLRLLEPLAPVPYAGRRIVAASQLLDAGATAVDGIRDVLVSLEGLTSVAQESEGLLSLVGVTVPDPAKKFSDITPDERRRILLSLYEAAPRMRQAAADMDAAIARLDALYRQYPSPTLRDRLEFIRRKLTDLRDRLRSVAPIAATLPSALGYPEAKHYLIFLENNTELRPTGGFLGVVGEADVKDGDLAGITIRDVYAYDGPSSALPRPEPPAPIRKYIGADKWFLRDANWSPDFQESARLMEIFYHDEAKAAFGSRPAVDGIIAVTPQVVQDVLRVTGPVTVDGKTFDADHLVEDLEFQVEYNFVTEGIPLAERKDIIADLFKEMLGRVTSLPVAKLLELIGGVGRNLDEKQALLSARDPAVQGAILSRGWGGEIVPEEGDTLLYVDANLASLKSDPAVERHLAYGIAPDGDGFVATAAMTYAHHGRFGKFTTRYRTYARVYVPEGATLLGVSGAMENDKLKDPRRRPGAADVSQEFGRTVFGAFISIEPGETRTLEFRYRLPESLARRIRAGAYTLDVAKQAGTIAHRLTLDLSFGKKLQSGAPAEQPKEFGDDHYVIAADLRTDRHFSVTLH